MAEESAAFTLACITLGELTELNRVQIRGSVRLALREAGLFDSQVTHAEMAVVAKRVLPPELTAGGVEDAERIGHALADRLSAIPDAPSEDAPDAVFARLGIRR